MVAEHLTPDRTRPQGVFWLAFGVLLAFSGQQLWQHFHADPLGDPVAMSLAAVERHDRLTVFSAQLSPVVSADDTMLMGALKVHQVAVIPARVDYSLDLAKLDKRSFSWEADKHRLTVTLPPLDLSRPNLDEGHAQYLREGMWIPRDVQAKLTQNNTLLAERQASEAAANPVLMDLARAAAKQAMQQNLSAPLKAAGYADATIEVRFNGDKP
jgi:hypothetical protein